MLLSIVVLVVYVIVAVSTSHLPQPCYRGLCIIACFILILIPYAAVFWFMNDFVPSGVDSWTSSVMSHELSAIVILIRCMCFIYLRHIPPPTSNFQKSIAIRGVKCSKKHSETIVMTIWNWIMKVSSLVTINIIIIILVLVLLLLLVVPMYKNNHHHKKRRRTARIRNAVS